MKLKNDQITMFFRQLGEMLNSGVPLVPALDVFTRDAKSELGPLAKAIASKVEHGSSLSDALKTQEIRIPLTLIVLVEIGETTGKLAESMLQATRWLKQDQDLVRKVTSSLSYPVFVFAVACILALSLFTTVVPKLLDVMIGMGAELPWPTRFVNFISNTLCEPLFWIVAGSGLCLFCYEMTVPATREKFVTKLTRILLKLPLVGPTLSSYYFVRFCNGLAVLAENGVPILDAVDLAQELSGHPDLLDDRDEFRQRVQSGLSLSEAMSSRDDLYPPLVLGFVLLGEQSATLADSVMRAADIQDMILQERLEAFRQALEPIMTLAVGALVAVILLATLLPLYSIVANI